jgi:hypothetical protein
MNELRSIETEQPPSGERAGESADDAGRVEAVCVESGARRSADAGAGLGPAM